MSRHLLVAALGAALSCGAIAQDKAQGGSAAAGSSAGPNVAMCVGCHGIPGYKTAFPSVYHVPKIGGQNPDYIVAALKAYKSGERSHPSMRAIAASLSEADMKAYAEYYGGNGGGAQK